MNTDAEIIGSSITKRGNRNFQIFLEIEVVVVYLETQIFRHTKGII